jgi:hypothetical protein
MAIKTNLVGMFLVLDSTDHEYYRKHLGRPRIDPALEKRIQSQLRAGKGILKVAAECGVGNGTVMRKVRSDVRRVGRLRGSW